MKQTLKTIAVFIGIGFLIYYFKARHDYSWADTKIEEAKKKQLILVAELKSNSILKPWTWFKKPTTEIWFTKANELVRVDSSNMAGHIWEYKFGAEPELEQFYVLYNLPLYSSHIIANKDTSFMRNHEFNKLEWTKEEPDMPGGIILEYFCSKNKYYSMLNLFGEDIDISNYIISGLYSPKDPNSKYIFELINNNPYKTTPQDDKIIRNGISKWLTEKYPNKEFSLEPNLYQKTKYISSQLGLFDKICDNYKVEIFPSNQIGKVEIEFDFSRLSIPTEYLKDDDIRIHNQIEDEK